MFRFLSILLTILAGWCQAAEPVFFAKVVGVHDGDTITVYDGARPQIKVRLASIDAPELKQPYGQAAKVQLSNLIFGQTVRITPAGRDRYRRMIAEVHFDNHWVNLQMVALGAAWRYDKYSSSEILLNAQRQASKAQLGLWSIPSPSPPWAWRKIKLRFKITILRSPKNGAIAHGTPCHQRKPEASPSPA